MENVKKEISNISIWLGNQIECAKADGFVIGLSGGIDSTAACGLAVNTVGREKVLGVLLPSKHGFGDDVGDGKRVAEHFGIKYINLSIKGAVDWTLELVGRMSMIQVPLRQMAFDEDGNRTISDVAIGNIQARMRMIHLRLCAEMNNYLVLGTTNKSEDLIGYFTKGGDGGSGVDVEPMAQYYKSEIKEFAKEFKIPNDLVNRTPSAGLWEGQTDEDELGFTYDDIEKYWRWKTAKETKGIIEDRPITVETAFKIEKMHLITKHKRNIPPSYNRK